MGVHVSKSERTRFTLDYMTYLLELEEIVWVDKKDT